MEGGLSGFPISPIIVALLAIFAAASVSKTSKCSIAGEVSWSITRPGY